MIAPLRELEWAKDPEVIAPPTDVIERWYRPILRKKLERLTDPDDDLQDVETRAYHDAEVLAQVIALNDKLLSLPGNPYRRAVFITADDAIHAAYEEDFWPKANPSRERFVLRRPWQYVPMLNAADIPNGYTLATLFTRIKMTLDTVLTTFSSPHQDMVCCPLNMTASASMPVALKTLPAATVYCPSGATRPTPQPLCAAASPCANTRKSDPNSLRADPEALNLR